MTLNNIIDSTSNNDQSTNSANNVSNVFNQIRTEGGNAAPTWTDGSVVDGKDQERAANEVIDGYASTGDFKNGRGFVIEELRNKVAHKLGAPANRIDKSLMKRILEDRYAIFCADDKSRSPAPTNHAVPQSHPPTLASPTPDHGSVDMASTLPLRQALETDSTDLAPDPRTPVGHTAPVSRTPGGSTAPASRTPGGSTTPVPTSESPYVDLYNALASVGKAESEKVKLRKKRDECRKAREKHMTEVTRLDEELRELEAQLERRKPPTNIREGINRHASDLFSVDGDAIVFSRGRKRGRDAD